MMPTFSAGGQAGMDRVESETRRENGRGVGIISRCEHDAADTLAPHRVKRLADLVPRRVVDIESRCRSSDRISSGISSSSSQPEFAEDRNSYLARRNLLTWTDSRVDALGVCGGSSPACLFRSSIGAAWHTRERGKGQPLLTCA
jgi:hypothetical protein